MKRIQYTKTFSYTQTGGSDYGDIGSPLPDYFVTPIGDLEKIVVGSYAIQKPNSYKTTSSWVDY